MQINTETVNIATLVELIRDINNESENSKEHIFSSAEIDESIVEISNTHLSVSFPEKNTSYKYLINEDKFEIVLNGENVDFNSTNQMYQNFHLSMTFFNQHLPVEILPDILKIKLIKVNTDCESNEHGIR